jgi:hypothetical protein
VKVRELIERLQAMDPEVQVAFFSRWWPGRERGDDPDQQAEVVVQITQAEIPHTREGEKKRVPVKVVCLNPSFKALDFAVGDRDRDRQGNPR